MSLIKILGVTLSNHLSVSDHIRDVISKCAQSLFAFKVLRCHGMNNEVLGQIYKAIVIAKLLHGGDSLRLQINGVRSFPGQSLSRTDVSRTRRFPDRRFPDKTFPGQTFPGQDDSRTDVSRTRRFPDRRFPDKTIPGQTFPGQYVFEAPFYSRWRSASTV